jgi:protein-tyrosine-phosphatase
MMNRIAAVCRANEVRSRIIEGYLKSHLRESEIKSFGTSITIGNQLSSTLIRKMDDWGIEINRSRPRSFLEDLDFLRQASFVLSADSETVIELAKHGIASLNICDFAVDNLHTPVDPLHFLNDQFLANAAKVVHCTSRLMSRVIEQKPSLALCTIFISSDNTEKIPTESGNYVIDARLRSVHDFRLGSQEVRYFRENELLDGTLSSSLNRETKFYSPKFEFRAPERALLSIEWESFIRGVANFGPVTVITTHTQTKSRELWDPYLASILADSVRFG